MINFYKMYSTQFSKAILFYTVTLTFVFGLSFIGKKNADLIERLVWINSAKSFMQGDYKNGSSYAITLGDAYTNDDLHNRYMIDKYLTKENVITYGALSPLIDQFNSELKCLSQAIYYEARSESASGRIAVAEVIMNRIKSKHFPNTVCDVVYQGSKRKTGCQFSFTCDGSMKIKPTEKYWNISKKTAVHVMIGASTKMTHGATHYHTTQVSPNWSKNMKQTAQYSTHVFYRFRRKY